MDLRELINFVAANYLAEKKLPMSKNKFAELVRHDGKDAVSDALKRDDLIVKCSVGAGNWSEIPWFGIFNPEITDTATKGLYVVYLFSANMETVYLCQGQGVTNIKEEFGKEQIAEMKRRAELMCARVPEYSSNFKSGPILLNGTTNLAKEYEPAIAYYSSYKTKMLPSLQVLERDLLQIVNLYDLLIARGGTDNLDAFDSISTADVDDKKQVIVERRRYVRHQKIERNSKAAKAAKKIHGYICEGCGFDFERIFGERGRGYIEAHHLVPLHTLAEGEAVSMDPKNDFAVLCANCHRVVHRKKPLLTIEQLRELKGVKMLRAAFAVKGKAKK